MPNINLTKAKIAKKDEFYTQISDIEKELDSYTAHFKDKIIYLNCDDPKKSNFYVYFKKNFNNFGFKKLISTHYQQDKKSYKAEVVDGKETTTELNGDGDFRSPECVELLKQADIVITNPPFSLFREYLDLLMEHGKKFLIIGNVNSITYKKTFKFIKEGKLWLGHSVKSRNMEFRVPPDYPITGKYREDEDGDKYVQVCVRWLTNLEYKERRQDITLHKRYSHSAYPKYENFDAINVDAISDIPKNYPGAIGVPITFMDKYNPDQFEILALGIVGSIEFSNNRKMEILDKSGKPTGKFTFNAKGTLYRKYEPEKDKKAPAFKDVETGQLYSSIYARVIIKQF